MTAILPPDTPDDIYPVPYRRRRVEKSLPIPKNVVRSMHAEGIRCMADLDLWLARGGNLTDLKGVGSTTEQKIMDAYQSMQEARKWIE